MGRGENVTNEQEKTREEIEKDFFKVMIWYFRERPTGFYNQLSLIKEKLETLNTSLEHSSNSSEKLATALNRLTLSGVIIAGLGVLVAIGHLILEIFKYTK